MKRTRSGRGCKHERKSNAGLPGQVGDQAVVRRCLNVSNGRGGEKRDISGGQGGSTSSHLGQAGLFVDFGDFSVILYSRVIGTRQGVSEMSSQVLHHDYVDGRLRRVSRYTFSSRHLGGNVKEIMTSMGLRTSKLFLLDVHKSNLGFFNLLRNKGGYPIVHCLPLALLSPISHSRWPIPHRPRQRSASLDT